MENSQIRKIKKIRKKIIGTAERPRLVVYKSNTRFLSQIINDTTGNTMAESHGEDIEKVAKDLAQKAKKEKIIRVVFDRHGYKYHGNIKKFCEIIRETGIII